MLVYYIYYLDLLILELSYFFSPETTFQGIPWTKHYFSLGKKIISNGVKKYICNGVESMGFLWVPIKNTHVSDTQ
jgi:hypothetical protein